MSGTRPSALVTGGSRGIGRAIARRLAERGHDLTLCARDAEKLEAAADELRPLGVSVTTFARDMADDSVVEAVAHHADSYGSMSAMVLAAGVGSAAPIAGYPLRRLDKQFVVNVRAPFALVAAALPLLRETAAAARVSSRVIAISSLEGVHPEVDLAAYGATKAALISLVRSVNVEEAANGVTATAISPAYVDTDMSAWVAETIPPESMLSVEDVVAAVDFVLSLSRTAVAANIVLNRIGGGEYHA